eukprot:CAMPEP_0117022020 /NCGR_PEP_ID=MMETSP0472-20121206/16594_1 /TAXON_ID=693140 ORGANISM="Tiarina fusus, Strain LIS" /NCGR_SAMPLE_ID=MMETSP0472 /ASSEMBLY_ACC=CAM_ASM_000603 /LENGTH=200 /DNA_ID=CAMNT_0004727759 /DNA_START=32 /DNA_END=634 /DNA_ORIENTATION=+
MTNSSSSSSSRANRTVSFNDAVRCIGTLHINNYTDEEVFNTWFTNQEFKQMKRDIKWTVSMMEQKEEHRCEDGVHYCSRGLEDKTTVALVHKTQHRFCAIDAVLDEQDRQREAGICDPSKLSLAYTEYSFISHMRAFLMGASDEKIALGCKHEEDKPSSSTTKTTRRTAKDFSCSSRATSFQKLFQISPSAHQAVSSMAA